MFKILMPLAFSVGLQQAKIISKTVAAKSVAPAAVVVKGK
ncbi:MAG: hypothetical protein JWP27_1312 [Flaviaesturariibacter sp.]|nr:hypothetical protein [Flaviaesturariibacter sp.]